MKRKYQLKERARRQAETRQRIVDATVGLHTSIGPAKTTVSAIASRAGVERHTVYAHFPDEETLFAACIAHWTAEHPLPDFGSSLQLDVPEARLRRVLSELYTWYEQVEPDLAAFLRDSEPAPHAAEMARAAAAMRELADALARGWPRRKTVRAAAGHAVEFETWRSLVRRQGLSRKQAVDAMVSLVAAS